MMTRHLFTSSKHLRALLRAALELLLLLLSKTPTAVLAFNNGTIRFLHVE
jgi:hypothetical protein